MINMRDAVVLLFSHLLSYGHCFPASTSNKHMTSQSHPMLASVFSVVNAVSEVNHGPAIGTQAASNVPPRTHPSVSFPSSMFEHNQLSANVVKAPPRIPTPVIWTGPNPGNLPVSKNDLSQIQPGTIGGFPGDDNRGIVSNLGDMQCRLCKELQDQECIKRWCWNEAVQRPGNTIDLSPIHTPVKNIGVSNTHNKILMESPTELGPVIDFHRKPLVTVGGMETAIQPVLNGNAPLPRQPEMPFSNIIPVPNLKNGNQPAVQIVPANPRDVGIIPVIRNTPVMNGVQPPMSVGQPSQLAARQTLDLVQNTLVDNPFKDIHGGQTMFESHIDKIHTVQFGPQHFTNPGTGLAPSPERPTVAVSSNTPNIERSPVPQDQNIQARLIPLSTHMLRQMVQEEEPRPVRTPALNAGNNGVRQSVPVANNVFDTSGQLSGPSVAVANDVFGPATSTQDVSNQHTLVLKQHRGGSNKVGIMIGDSNPSNGMLSLMETSGQLPVDRPVVGTAIQPNAHVAVDTDHAHGRMSHGQPSQDHSSPVFIPISNIGNSNRPIIQQDQSQIKDPVATSVVSQNSMSMNQGMIVPVSMANQNSLAAMSQDVSQQVPHLNSMMSGQAINSQAGSMSNSGVMTNGGSGNSVGSSDILDAFPAGFVESILSTTTPIPTINPIRKAELQNWGARFLPTRL